MCLTFYHLLDDKFILSYLRGCKFSYEKTKKKIDMWHAMRFHCPEYFSGWDPLEKKNDEILSQGYENIKICLILQWLHEKIINHDDHVICLFGLQGYCSIARIR